jgi:aryl-alcohol dehydrogenase
MLGTLVLIGGRRPGRFSLDHLTTLRGKRVIGVFGGGGRSGQLILALVTQQKSLRSVDELAGGPNSGITMRLGFE